MRAWEVQAAVDWPPGSSRDWPNGGIGPAAGNNRPAVLVVAVEGEEMRAIGEALRLLRAVGHRWVQVVQVKPRPDITARAQDIVVEALFRAQEESRAARIAFKAGLEFFRGLGKGEE